MHKNLLNIIIGVSLFGILIGAVRENIKNSSEQASSLTQYVSPTAVPTPISSGTLKNLVPCKNDYFSFAKGSSWEYQIKTASSSSTFTSTIIASTESEITLESKFEKNNTSQKSTLSCEDIGIAGFPFPIMSVLSSDSSGNTDLLKMIKLDDQMLFLPPNNKLVANGTWDTPIKINIPLPINTGGLDVALNNKVIKVSNEYILQQTVPTLDINTTFNSGSLAGILGGKTTTSGQTLNIFTYKLAKGIGIVDFKFTLNLDKTTTQPLEIKLLRFTKGM